MTYQLTAEKRATKGTRTRLDGKLPGIVYGGSDQPISIALNAAEFVKLYSKAGESSLIDLLLDGAGSGKVLVQAVQQDPVTDRVIHVDLKRIDMTKRLRAPVTLKFVGESPAVKGLGGTLVTTLHSVEVECLPNDLVSHLEIKLDGLANFSDVIKVRDIVLPAELKIVSPHPDDMVAKVAAPLTEEQIKAMEEEAKAPADLSKIEVAGEKEKAEAAAAAAEAEGKGEAKKEEKKEEKK